MVTKQGGGSDTSLKGLGDVFIRMDDAAHFGGLNNTLAKLLVT